MLVTNEREKLDIQYWHIHQLLNIGGSDKFCDYLTGYQIAIKEKLFPPGKFGKDIIQKLKEGKWISSSASQGYSDGMEGKNQLLL